MKWWTTVYQWQKAQRVLFHIYMRFRSTQLQPSGKRKGRVFCHIITLNTGYITKYHKTYDFIDTKKYSSLAKRYGNRQFFEQDFIIRKLWDKTVDSTAFHQIPNWNAVIISMRQYCVSDTLTIFCFTNNVYGTIVNIANKSQLIKINGKCKADSRH